MNVRITLVVTVLGLLLGKSTQESVECGKRTVNYPLKDKILSHDDVYPGQWPWSSAIYARKNNQTVEYICGGALISRRFVITSRLCVTGEAGALLATDKVLIRMGTHKHNVVNVGKAQHRYVTRIHQPIEYDVTSKNEVVLLETRVEVRFTDYVQPVCIYQYEEYAGKELVAIGWGAQNTHKNLATISEPLSNCRSSQAEYKDHKELCERDRGSIFHEFDNYDGVWYMRGIIDCERVSCEADKRINGFLDVAYYVTFVIKVANLDYLQKVRKGQRFDPSQNYPNLLPTRNCGHTLTNQIEKGPNTRLYEFLWVARLQYYNKFTDKISVGCLGTLISYRYVLTGATCYVYYTPQIVRLGDYNVNCDLEDENKCALPVRHYDVEYTTVHPDYEANRVFYDIALVRTTKDVRYEDHIHPVCLPVSQELRQLKLPEYVATGWNIVQRSPILQKSSLTTLNNSECFNYYYGKGLESHPAMFICTKALARVTLKQDMEPLGQYVSDNGVRRFVQFGFIQGAHVGDFSYHMNVSNFMDWIIANMHE